jgi:peptide deformylase
MLLQLHYYGDPVLRKKTVPVTKFDQELKKLAADMVETMESSNGIGLAAAQLNRSESIIVVKSYVLNEEGKEKRWVRGPLHIFVNPKLSNPSDEVWSQEEGCLSIPGIYAEVERPWRITLEWQDLDGNTHKKEFVGYEARTIMHESDHNRGVLFIDRVTGKERQAIEPKLKELKKKHAK